MSKIISFIVIVPFMALIIFKSVLFYEFNTKQVYIKDITDNLAYKVKITGILSNDDLTEFQARLNKVSKFKSSEIVLRQGLYVDGVISDWTVYMPGNVLNRGQAFMIYVKSSDVSLFSRLQNGGVMADEGKNLYFSAKAQCRIEKD